MIVLGLHFEHDAGATLMKDGTIVISVEAERVTGRKHDAGGMATVAAIEVALSQSGIRAGEIDAIAFSDLWGEAKDIHPERLDRLPIVQKETHGPRLAATRGSFANSGLAGAIPMERVPLRQSIPVFLVCHSISHAASALYMSGAEEAAGLVVDGYGTCCGMMAYTYRNGILARVEQFKDRFLLGAGYTTIGRLAREMKGTSAHDIPGKIMGLHAYGKARPEWVEFFCRKFFSSTPESGYDDYVNWCFDRFDPKAAERSAVQASVDEICRELFPQGLERAVTSVDDANYRDLVASMQEAFTRIVAECFRELTSKTRIPDVFFSGGCALNILANSAVAALPEVRSLFVNPNPSDCGQSMGCAIVGMHALTGLPVHRPEISSERRSTPFIGASLVDDPEHAPLASGIRRCRFSWSKESDLNTVVQRLIDGEIIGLVSGPSEIGPRALGNRSLIALASHPQMKDRINKVKRREWWRPFAAVCRQQDATEYFVVETPSRYMLMNNHVREKWRQALSAVNHVDNSCRLQVLSRREEHSIIWDLLAHLDQQAAIPVLLNTSFNLSRKPLVNSAKEVVELLSNSDMTAAIVEDWIFCKQ
jgi:carbamoyltransferase